MAANNEIVTSTTNGLTKEDVRKTVLDLDIKEQQPQSALHTTNSTSNTVLDQTIQHPTRTLPPTTRATRTTPNVDQFVSNCADVASHATIDHPLTHVFEHERLKSTHDPAHPQPPASVRLPIYRPSVVKRFQGKLAGKSFIIEAGNFAAIACWTPSSAIEPPPPPQFFTTLAERDERPILSKFLADIEAAKKKYLYPLGHRFWELSLMARDPRREYVPGAVRAVIEPVLKMAEEEKVPVWLEAGSQRAREIYEHFGFVVVHIIWVAHVETWCMIKPCQK